MRARTAKVVELRSAGRTKMQIAEELGVAQSTMSADGVGMSTPDLGSGALVGHGPHE